MASGRWTARWCDEAEHAAPLGPAWSTHQASPNGLQRRAGGATSDLVRPLAARRICCSEPVPGHISRPGRPRHVWFPGLISSSAVAPRALQRDKMDELGTGGPAPIFSGPFPWFFAFERLISRFRRRSSLFILILINRSNSIAIPAESHYRPISRDLCESLIRAPIGPCPDALVRPEYGVLSISTIA